MYPDTLYPLKNDASSRCVLAAGVLLCAAAWHDAAQAQVSTPAPSFSPVSSPTFVIKGFDIVGENPLADGEASLVLAPFLRVDATIETLQKATAALEARLKDKGFALHRVVLPPQDVGGSIKLNVVKFVIGKVTVEGLQQFSEANIRASVPEIVEGAAPNFQTLAVQTTMANESQAKNIQVALKESDEQDKIDVRIVVKETKPWNFSVNASNTGSSATGADRLTLSGGHANVFGLDHQLTAAYTTSVERPAAVKQLGLNYRLPLYRWGGVVGVSYTQSDVLGDFGAFKSTGAGKTMGLNYNHYFAPDGGYRSNLNLGLDDKQFDVTQINGVALADQMVRRSRPLTLGYSARVEADTMVWGYNADLAMNTPGGSGNDLAAYQSEDPRITTTQWVALRGGANYTTVWGGGWLWGIRGQFQYSANPLISGEQFGLGGSASVRGTGERPISGDSGALVSMEVTAPELFPGLRLLGFVDAGWLGNHATAGTPKLSRDGLSSVGIGLRYAVPNFVVSADFGHVMGGSSLPYVSGSGLPQSGDQKLHINLSARF
jgi:hemolysin activation/secretion protein